MKAKTFILTLALALFGAKSMRAAQDSAVAIVTSTNNDTEAAYTQNLEKRVADILVLLDLNDSAKSNKVHDILIAQYRALRDWHTANDKKLKDPSQDPNEIRASLKSLHTSFLTKLSFELTPGQVEKVKDKMTYGKVKVTYDAYIEIVPKLTDAEKQKIMDLLVEAREEAMDGGSSNEKSAVFKKYKGKINNYLDSQGHNVKQAYKDWGAQQKAKASPPVEDPTK